MQRLLITGVDRERRARHVAGSTNHQTGHSHRATFPCKPDKGSSDGLQRMAGASASPSPVQQAPGPAESQRRLGIRQGEIDQDVAASPATRAVHPRRPLRQGLG